MGRLGNERPTKSAGPRAPPHTPLFCPSPLPLPLLRSLPKNIRPRSWLLWIPSLVISVVDMRRGEGITGGGKRYPVGTPA